ncbi:hypothetical protein AC578_2771 [Pseudocercospora eumusae]|uniref:Uncharacterized protein n=1 Tax=Pseudocercospora eumusae TaxID=321146 RepID=A0A139HH23_9PEZI|nr:hypothetical protein AC578_2771 [Pseudocercospora eumusae]
MRADSGKSLLAQQTTPASFILEDAKEEETALLNSSRSVHQEYVVHRGSLPASTPIADAVALVNLESNKARQNSY